MELEWENDDFINRHLEVKNKSRFTVEIREEDEFIFGHIMFEVAMEHSSSNAQGGRVRANLLGDFVLTINKMLSPGRQP